MDEEYEKKSQEILGEVCKSCVHFSEVNCPSPVFKESILCTRNNTFVKPEADACMAFKNKKGMIDG